MARKPRLNWKDPELLSKVEMLAAQGLTDGQIAEVIGVSRRTITNYKTHDCAFCAAIKRGEAKGVAQITNALFTSAKNGNLGAQVFYLKNKAGWSDKLEHAVTHFEPKNIDEFYGEPES